MPAGRPAIDFEALKPEIVRLHRNGQNYEEIAFQVGSSERTIKRRLAEWGIRKRAPKVQKEDGLLRSQVAIYFIANFSDDEMVYALKSQGWRVHRRTVERIRKSQGLLRRFSAFGRQVAVDKLWDVIKNELDSGSIEGYSRKLLHTHFKKLGHQLSEY